MNKNSADESPPKVLQEAELSYKGRRLLGKVIVRTLTISTVINIYLHDWSFLYSYEKNTVIGNGKPTKAKPTYTEALVGDGGEGGT